MRAIAAVVVLVTGLWLGWPARLVIENDVGEPALPIEKSKVDPRENSPVAEDVRAASSSGGADKRKYEAASASLPLIPRGSKIISVESEINAGLKETVVKLESYLPPDELQIFYTDALVNDWMIYRDTLTGEVGWNGVFLQIGDIERRLGIFAVVNGESADGAVWAPAQISLLMVEQI